MAQFDDIRVEIIATQRETDLEFRGMRSLEVRSRSLKWSGG